MISLFQVEYGRNEAGQGADTLIRVPVRYGDASRNAQTIMQENSTNALPSTPLMTFYIHALEYDRPRMQDPSFVDRINVRQRTYDPVTDSYETTQGNAFTIERLMPVPYNLGITLDIWTSNTNQKMQILEQILTLFNPSLEIQSTDNYIDWTSLSIVNLDSVNWSSKNIPVGTGDPIDIATIKFSLPIWISSPAKVKKLGVVERIITNIFDSNGDASNAVTNNDLLMGTRMTVTPFNYQVLLIDGKLQVLQQQAVVTEPNSSLEPANIDGLSNVLWPSVLTMYGVLRPGVSQIRLEQDDDTEVIGTISLDPSDNRFLLYDIDIDTVPQNTLTAIDAVIDPLISGPGDGLDSALIGQRYLLTEDTGSKENSNTAEAWAGTSGQPLIAKANDIIEFDGRRWRVSFVSTEETTVQYVTNLTTGLQYKWTGTDWVKSYQGLYPGGTWRLVL